MDQFGIRGGVRMDNWLKNNNVLKIVSLVLAVMLWLVVNMDTAFPNVNSINSSVQGTYYYETNVVPIYNSNDYVVKIIDDNIKVSLRGSAALINQIKNGTIIDKAKFYVDLSNYSKETQMVPVHYSGFPKGIDVQVDPSLIKVQIEAKQRKEIGVKVEKSGKEVDGYQTGEPIITPKKVHISGAKEEIDKVAFVKAFINVDNVKKPILQEVPLRAYDSNGNIVNVDISPQTVELEIPVTSPYVTVPITFSITSYPLGDIAIKSITRFPKEITLYGAKEVIKTYKVYTGPAIDLSHVKEDQTLNVSIPKENGLLKTEPNFMQLQVKVGKSTTKTINNVPVKVQGLSMGLKAKLLTQNKGVSVELKGAKEVLASKTKDDLDAYIDVTNLPSGVYELPVEYNVPLLTQLLNNKVTAKVEIQKE